VPNGGTIRQSGTVTPGHVAAWTADGVVQDSGPATNGFLTEIGITKNGGIPFGITTRSNLALPYARFTLSIHETSGAIIGVQGYNGLATPPLLFDIGGVIYPFTVSSGVPSVQNVAALRAGTVAIPVLYLQGYYTPGDGGGGMFTYVSTDTTSADNGGTIIVDGDGHRYYRDTGGQPYDVRWFGAVGNGVADDATTIQAAIDSGAQALIFPRTAASVYRTTAALEVSDDQQWFLETGVTINGTSVTTGSAVVAAEGPALVALPALSRNPTAGSKTLVFGSAPSVSAGSVIVLYDPTDGSYNASRNEYRAGEYCEVRNVSGATVTLASPLYETYDASVIDAYRMDAIRFGISGGTIQAPTGAVTVDALSLTRCRDFDVTDTVLLGATDSLLAVTQCVSARLSKVRATSLATSAPFTTGYGIVVSNCQGLDILDCEATAFRHGITVGGGNYIGCVPNRNIKVRGGTYVTTGTLAGADFHGNVEHSVMDGLKASNGITGGGDKNAIQNCRIIGTNLDVGTAVYLTDLAGLSWTIQNNEAFVRSVLNAQRGAFVDVGGNDANALTANTRRGGTLIVKGNRYVDQATLPYAVAAILIRNRGCTQELNIEVVDNDILAAGYSYMTAVNMDRISGAEFNRVVVNGNRILNGSIAVQSGKYITIRKNVIEGGGNNQFGIRGTVTVDYGKLDIQDNTVLGAQLAAIRGERGNANIGVTVVEQNNHVVGYNARNSGSTFWNAGLYAFAQTAWIGGNVVEQQGWWEPPAATASIVGTSIVSVAVTGAGKALFSVPSVTIGGDGASATAAASLALQTYALNAAGTNYLPGDTLTAVGGTFATAARFVVIEVTDAGGVQAVSMTTGGVYSALPTNPVNLTGGTGASAAFDFAGYGLAAVSVTAAGSGYSTAPVTFAVAAGTPGGTIRADTVGTLFAAPNSAQITRASVTTAMEVAFNGANVALPSLPTSTVGLATGAVYRDGSDFLKVIP
jgi:hypothetical protein